ncbi:unnamed protein product [Arabis nemorensis]|uniref:Uncharacterized protein n=1 Tax=Arabis nemorensis TaxID=586526 RepID=A0A565C6Z7_9BRAS|nr:unnamed protein product [Arabis nemorensis]
MMVLKDQIRVIKLGESEVRYLEKIVLFGNHKQRIEAWDNRGYTLQENLRAAQIQGISRRMMGIIRSVSKLPTYRRRFRQVVKALITYWSEKQGLNRSGSMSSIWYTSRAPYLEKVAVVFCKHERAKRAKQSTLRLRLRGIKDNENCGSRTRNSLSLAERIEKAGHFSRLRIMFMSGSNGMLLQKSTILTIVYKVLLTLIEI